MRQALRLWLLLTLSLGLLSGLPVAFAAATSVRVAPDPDFAPVDFVDGRGRHQGLSARLLELLAPRAELRFEARRFASREQARAALLQGDVDLLSAVLVDSGDSTLRYSRPYLRLPAALLGRAGAGAPTTLEELAGRRVVVVRGRGWAELLTARVPEARIQETADLRAALRMLQTGDAEVLVSDLPSAEFALRQSGLADELGVLGNPDLHVDLAFAALPVRAELLDRLDRALETVTAAEDADLRERLFESSKARGPEAASETIVPPSLESAIQRLRERSDIPVEQRDARLAVLDSAAAVDREADQLLAQREQLLADVAAARSLLDAPELPNLAAELLRWRSSLPARASLEDLEQLRALELAARDDLLTAMQQAVSRIETLRQRPGALRRDLAAAAQPPLTTPQPDPADPVAMVLGQAEARRDAARSALLRSELDDADLLLRAAERQQRERQQTLLLREERIAVLETRIAEQSDQEILALLEQLREDLQRLDAAPALLREVAAENVAIGERMLQQSRRLSQLREEDLRLERRAQEVARALSSARARVEIGGITPAVGRLLMAERRKLPAAAEIETQLRAVQSELVEVRLAQLAVGDEREVLTSINTAVRDRLGGDQDQVQLGDPASRTTLIDLHLRRAELLPRLEQQQQRLATGLEAAERHLRQLGNDGRALSGLIEQHLLWVPSHRGWSRPWLEPLTAELADLLKPERWSGTVRRLLMVLDESPVWWALLLLPALLWSLWPRIDRALQGLATAAASKNYASTSAALALTLVRAAPMALLLLLLGSLLQIAGEGGRFTHNLGRALVQLVPHVYLATLLIASCRPGGLADAHLRWPQARRAALLQLRPWLYFVLLPLLFLVELGQARDLDYPAGLILQLALSLTSLVLVGISVWLLAPGRLFVGPDGQPDPQPKWRLGLRFGFIAGGAVLAALPFAGYVLTVGRLLGTLLDTLWMLYAVLLGHGLVWRWLFLSERRLAESSTTVPSSPARTDESGQAVTAEDVPDPKLACTQSHGLLRATTAMLLGAGLIWSLAPVAPAFNLLDTITLWQTVTQVDGANVVSPVTLGDVLLAIVALVYGVIAARNLPGLLELLVLQRFPVDASLRYAIVTVSRYLITFLLLVLVFGLLGVRWGHLQWMAAAFSVGLGFGLQEIFGNFVAGLILLFERPFRVGDVVTIGNFTGTVRKIRTRATTIVDFDNKDIVIPNKSLITDRFVNWTLSDSSTRLIVKVGVDYGADPEAVRALLLEIAGAHPQVLRDPAPLAFLMEFGPNALHFELRCFVGTIADRLRVTHALHTQILAALRERGISIPFPQMDVHLPSVAATGHGLAAH